MGTTAFQQLLMQAGIANASSWSLRPGITIGAPFEYGGHMGVPVDDAARQESRFVALQDIRSILEPANQTFNVAGPLRASPAVIAADPAPGPMCGSTDPRALNPYASNEPNAEIDDETLAEIIRQMGSDDPALSNAALQALTNAWARAESQGPDSLRAFNEKVDEANRRVQAERAVQSPNQQDQQDAEAPAVPQPRRVAADSEVAAPTATGSGTSPRSTVVPFVASTGGQGAILGGFGESGILFTGSSLDDVAVGAPILSAIRFAPPALESASVASVDSAGPGSALVRTESFGIDGASTANSAVPMLVTASGVPVPLTPFTVDVSLYPSPAVGAALRTAPDDQYFAILFGSQAASNPFMRFLSSAGPENQPIVHAARARVSQLLADRQAVLGLSSYATPGFPQTTTLSFHCDPRSGMIVAAIGPAGMRLNELLANASEGSHGPMTRRLLSRGAGPTSYFSHTSHFEDHDLSMSPGVFVSYIPIHQYMTIGRPLSQGPLGAFVARRDGTGTDLGPAGVFEDASATDHQKNEGGNGGGSDGHNPDEEDAYAWTAENPSEAHAA